MLRVGTIISTPRDMFLCRCMSVCPSVPLYALGKKLGSVALRTKHARLKSVVEGMAFLLVAWLGTYEGIAAAGHLLGTIIFCFQERAAAEKTLKSTIFCGEEVHRSLKDNDRFVFSQTFSEQFKGVPRAGIAWTIFGAWMKPRPSVPMDREAPGVHTVSKPTWQLVSVSDTATQICA